MSEVPGEKPVNLRVVRAVLEQLVDVWQLYLLFYVQVFMIHMLFGLLHSFIQMLRLPQFAALGGVR